MLSSLVVFPRYQEIAAGGFPITSRQGIDLSPPTSTSIVLFETGADGLSGHKKSGKIRANLQRGTLHALEDD